MFLAWSIPLAESEETITGLVPMKYDPAPALNQTSVYPGVTYGIHRNGMLWTVIHSNGIIGDVYGLRLDDYNKVAPSFYYPRYSRKQHGYTAALWIGGVVGRDTLVSVTLDSETKQYQWILPVEFWPDEYPIGAMQVRSNLPTSSYYDEDAKAEMEFEATYCDTFEGVWWVPDNEYDRRRHRPMGLKVTQTSYSWSANYAADFIIVNYAIENIGSDTILDAWAGIQYNGCNFHRSEVPSPPSDDIAGYIYSWPSEFEEVGDELMQAIYCIDNDGNSFSLPWDLIRTAAAFSIAPLHAPGFWSRNNFNWWCHPWEGDMNWGPRQYGSVEHPLRLYQGELGQPRSDKDKYDMLSRSEIDYCTYEMAVDHSRYGWLPPPDNAGVYAKGLYPKMLTSFGPFDLYPGDGRVLTVVLSIGDDVHYNRSAFYYTFDTLNPQPFMDQLDWTDLITNIRWAKLIYDNPGVDTDLDGDSGSYVLREESFTGDTVKVYYEGDGVPDFRGAQAPPPPEVRVIPRDGEITIRWNGYLTETYYDPLSFVQDFEGYRVYIGRSASATDVSLLSSWDAEDFNVLKWDEVRDKYVLVSLPLSLVELREAFGEDFNPTAYTRTDPFKYDGYLYYFEPVDYNMSDLSDPDGIHKLYPDAVLDTSDVDEEGRLRYYEYEFVIKDLQTTVPWFVSVTAFDFGHPPKSLDPLESNPELNMVEVFAIGQGDDAYTDLKAFVYPNPYRVDANYAQRGLENRGDYTSTERARRIYFANLPPRCTIKVFSLDGDLIKQIEHDEPAWSGTRTVEEWDLISRNVQAIVSGLYYWTVESDYGTQIGKLVILK